MQGLAEAVKAKVVRVGLFSPEIIRLKESGKSEKKSVNVVPCNPQVPGTSAGRGARISKGLH